MSQAIEKTYGTPLKAEIIKLLLQFKEDEKTEITTFFIAGQLKKIYPELKEYLNTSEERRRLRKRIENCLKNLVEADQLKAETKKAAIQTNYIVYHVNF